jgi:anti-sigma regulatory factor (Ser/Thr protein kinase)
MSEGWTCVSRTRHFPRAVSSVPAARSFLEQICGHARLPSLVAENVVLLISELVSNAVLHGSGPSVIDVTVEPGHIRVAVHDEGQGAPQIQRHAPVDADHGRGLFLVEKLSTRWGIAPRTATGKSVWFEIDRL